MSQLTGRSILSPLISAALRESEHRIVITGAGGWLGMATLDLLRAALDHEFHSRVRCFGSQARTLLLSGGSGIEQRPLAELGKLDERPTLLLHLAFLTKDRALVMTEDDYRHANRELSRIVLDCMDAIGTEAVFVASSGAAHATDNGQVAPAQRLYGSLKRDDEDRFARWASERHRTAVICRIFNISGPHINKHQNYALAAFILDALAKQPLVVRAPHRVVRGYVAIRELMSLVLALLLQNKRTVIRFDSGGAPMEMDEIARSIASVLGVDQVGRPAPIEHGADEYFGDDAAYQQLLATFGIASVPFVDQIVETASYLSADLQRCNDGPTRVVPMVEP